MVRLIRTVCGAIPLFSCSRLAYIYRTALRVTEALYSPREFARSEQRQSGCLFFAPVRLFV